jgi:hypothetical protein
LKSDFSKDYPVNLRLPPLQHLRGNFRNITISQEFRILKKIS